MKIKWAFSMAKSIVIQNLKRPPPERSEGSFVSVFRNSP